MMNLEETVLAIAQAQLRTQQAIEAVIQVQMRMQETIGGLAESVSSYADAADARMRRIEENLDGLIRAITAEHSNGKSHRQ